MNQWAFFFFNKERDFFGQGWKHELDKTASFIFLYSYSSLAGFPSFPSVPCFSPNRTHALARTPALVTLSPTRGTLNIAPVSLTRHLCADDAQMFSFCCTFPSFNPPIVFFFQGTRTRRGVYLITFGRVASISRAQWHHAFVYYFPRYLFCYLYPFLLTQVRFQQDLLLPPVHF